MYCDFTAGSDNHDKTITIIKSGFVGNENMKVLSRTDDIAWSQWLYLTAASYGDHREDHVSTLNIFQTVGVNAPERNPLHCLSNCTHP